MGHGLCAMLLGGSFVSLGLFPDGSGYAVHSGTRFLGQPGLALIAAAGPLGPALAEALLIFLSLRPKSSRRGLAGVALVMLLSAVIWIRTLFGFSLIVLLALVLLLIRWDPPCHTGPVPCPNERRERRTRRISNTLAFAHEDVQDRPHPRGLPGAGR